MSWSRAWLLVSLFVLSPAGARAECTFEGEVHAADVVPEGSSVSLTLEARARVVVEGATARVDTTAPFALRGRTSSARVRFALARAETLAGVVHGVAGTPVRVLRVVGDRARVRLDTPVARVFAEVSCDALALATSDTLLTARAEPGGAEGSWVWAREGVLDVHATRSGGRPVRLRDPDRTDAYELLALRVIERGARLRVRVELAQGVTLEGWVDPARVAHRAPDLRAVELASSGGGSCGWGYAGERSRLDVELAVGTELLDERGLAIARLTEPTRARVAISVTRWTAGRDESMRRGADVIVYVDQLTGLVPPPCSGLGLRVSPDAVAEPVRAVLATLE